MHMSKLIAASVLAFGVAIPAAEASQKKGVLDPNARILACYKEVKVPAKYSVKKVLIKKAEKKYLRKGGLVYLVEYPAIYREDKTLVEPEHILMREVKCKS